MEEMVEFEFKDYSILLQASKVQNVLKLSRDNYGGGTNQIIRGIATIEEIQNLVEEEI